VCFGALLAVAQLPQSVAAAVESGDWSAFRVDVEVMQPRAFRVVS